MDILFYDVMYLFYFLREVFDIWFKNFFDNIYVVICSIVLVKVVCLIFVYLFNC